MKKYFIRHKWILLLSVIITIMASFLDVGIAFVLEYIIDATTSGSISNMIAIGIKSFIFMLVYAIVSCCNTLCKRECIKRILVHMKHDIFVEHMTKNVNSFHKKNIAEYISSLTNDINILEKEYLETIFGLLTIIFNFILGCISITILNRTLALFAVLISIVVLVIPVLFGKKLEQYKIDFSNRLSDFTVNLKDDFSGFEIIKGYNLEERIIEKFDDSSRKVEKVKFKMFAFNAYLTSITSLINYFTICIVLVLVGIKVIQGALSVGAAIAAMQLLDYIIDPINTIGIYINKLVTNKKLINKLLAREEIVESEEKIEIQGFEHKITFNKWNYSYDKKNTVLHDIDFEFEKNKKYIIVGNSGGGKSTLVHAIAGMLLDYSGSLKIDGVELNQIDEKSLNKLVSTIYQNVFLFDDTILNNITLYDKNVTPEQISQALKESGLEKMMLSKNINEMVGDNGEYLSGGEKQRIAIARSLTKNTPILILDEATSALDSETAFNIESTLLSIEELTLIVVSHKFIVDNMKKYDCILAINNGKLVEHGSFQELMKKRGYFYSLFTVVYGESINEQSLEDK